MTFEDRLLTQLRAVVAENPAPAPKQRTGRRRLALSGAGIATAAAAAVVLIAGGGASADPAYAVQKRSDGEVTVTVNSLSDAQGLQDKLRATGIPADVSYDEDPACGDAPVQPGLHAQTYAGDPPVAKLESAGSPPPDGTAPMITSSVQSDGAATFVIDPDTIHPGDRLTIRASVGHLNTLSMGIGPEGQTLPAIPCPPDAK